MLPLLLMMLLLLLFISVQAQWCNVMFYFNATALPAGCLAARRA